jgi:hypothetical protein
MDEESVKSIIVLQRINNHFLGLVDSVRDNQDLSIIELLRMFYWVHLMIFTAGVFSHPDSLSNIGGGNLDFAGLK